MTIQIADPQLVAKIETAAKQLGVSETDAVGQAIDKLLGVTSNFERKESWDRIKKLLQKMDKIPDVEGAFDPLEWDENGLPV